MPAPAFYSPGTVLADKYRVERLLGHGGMGAVYVAEHLGINRRVAIKVLLPQFAHDGELLARFRNEARAASAIHHAGIVEMLDLGAGPAGEPFLVMELLDGESLGVRLRRTGPLELDVAAWIVLQVLDAVGAAHERGIVHRDLKPDNVFLVVSPRTAVKVLDFGISKFHQEDEPSLTATRTVLGTPAYMAPEQARSARAASPASDLYAVGAILYEALAGAPIFDGQSYNEVVAKVLTEPPLPLRNARPDLPEPVLALVHRLLAKDPADRPANAAEAGALLRSALASAVATPDLRGVTGVPAANPVGDTLPKGSPPPAALAFPDTQPSPAPRSAKPPARRRGWIAGAGLVGALGVLAVFSTKSCSFRFGPQPEAPAAPAAADAALAREPVDAAPVAPGPPDAAREPPDASATRPDAATRVRAPAGAPAMPPRVEPARALPRPDAGRTLIPPADEENPFAR